MLEHDMKPMMLKRLDLFDNIACYFLCAVICIMSLGLNSSSQDTISDPDPDPKWWASTFILNAVFSYTVITASGMAYYNSQQTSGTETGPFGTSTQSTGCASPANNYIWWLFPDYPGAYQYGADHYVGYNGCGYVGSTGYYIDATQVAINYFYSNPASVSPGGSATLRWSTSLATAVSINGTSVPASGSMVVNPSISTTYTITASNPYTSAQASTTVTVAIPLNANFYKYSVRHEKGARPFFPYMPVEQETVNSANGNLHFSVPLLSRPGRNGLGVNLSIAYNSKVWDFYVQGGTLYATLPEYDSWLGPGWTLTMGRMIDDSANGYYYFSSSDGANHTLMNYGGAWRSTDSTYMVYDPGAKKLTLKNGVNLRFNYQDPLRPYLWYATRIQDTSGNYLDITYSGTGGRISTIQDTLGNTYTFLLTSAGRLQYIKYWNTNDTTEATSTIALGYQSILPSFGSQATMDPGMVVQPMLTSVTYVTGVRYSFCYNPSGQLEEIGYPTNGTSRYFYSKYTVNDRVLNRTVPDYFVTMHDKGPGGNAWLWGNNPNGAAAPASASIIIPGKSSLTHFMQKNSAGWADGFATAVIYGDSSLSEQSLQDWTQDDEQLTTIRNPRLLWAKTGKKMVPSPYTEKFVRREFTYASTSDYSGNIKELREYAFDQTTLRRKTVLSYLHESNGSYANLNILDRVTSTLVYDGESNLLSKTVAAYDSFSPLYGAPNAIRHDSAFGTAYLTRGLPTTVTKWYNIAQNASIATISKYDECGNVREVIDPSSYSTFLDYWLSAADNAYVFPLRIINAKGQVSNTTYSYKSGVALAQTNANGQIIATTYDSADRPTQATKSDGWRKTIEYHQDPPYATVRQYVTADTYQEHRANLDNWGRVVEEIVSDPSGGNIEQQRTYDSAGQVSTLGVPHRDGAASYGISYNTGGVASKSASLPGGMTVSQWNDPNAATISTEGRSRQYFYQEDGKISKVLEQDATTGNLDVATDYVYDALSRLTLISQGSQTRTFVYDDMGRLLSETHPENGTTLYSYDENSNLVSRTDARGITTTYYYDELNRVTQKTYSDGTPAVNYYYDIKPPGSPLSTPPIGDNLIGRLAKVTTTAAGLTASSYYSYCSCSAITQEATVIGPSTYITQYAYNLAGQLTSMTYPNGKVVNYTRDSIGREKKVSSSYNGQAFDYIYDESYNGPQGQLTEIVYPLFTDYYATQRVMMQYTYSPETTRLTRLKTLNLQSNYNLDLEYSYWNPGIGPSSQLMDVTDYVNPDANEHFEYDRLGRLTKYWRAPDRTGNVQIQVSYDRYGNISGVVEPWKVYPSSTLNVDASTNRLLSRTYQTYQYWGVPYLATRTFAYDAVGNMISMGSFDAENRLVLRNGTSYLYDGNGRRFREQGGSTIDYVYSFSGQLLVKKDISAGTTDDFVYSNGQLAAIQQQDGHFRLLLKDCLGSTRRVLLANVDGPDWNKSGYWLLDQGMDAYDPWGYISGGFSYSSPGVNYLYEGKERSGGLDNFGARWFETNTVGLSDAASSMRWISVDPVMGRIYDPQSLNRYTYVRNDPVNLVDPDGRFYLPGPGLGSGGGAVLFFGPWAPISPFLGLGWWDLDAGAVMVAAQAQPGFPIAMAQAAQAQQQQISNAMAAAYSMALGQLGVTLQNISEQANSSSCYSFLDGIIQWTHANNAGNAAFNGTVSTIIGTVENTPINLVFWDNGTTANNGGQQVSTWSVLNPFQPNYANAFVEQGVDRINVGPGAFLTGNPGATLLHEAFHLLLDNGTAIPTGFGIDDIELAKAAGVWTPGMSSQDASAAAGTAFRSNCP
jgi:RHS repeat-associated protein